MNIRSLDALGIQSDQYGSLLIPVIKSKLPSDVRLQIARRTEKDVWVIKDLLEIIRREVEARELSEQVKANSEIKKPPSSSVPNTSSLTAQGSGGSPITCAYCGKQHYSAPCETVVLSNERKDILRRAGRCFVCLSIGHRSSQCFPSRKCRCCQGAHHQSICTQGLKRIPVSTKPGSECNEGTRKPADLKTKENDSVSANQISTTVAQASARFSCKPRQHAHFRQVNPRWYPCEC